jgi:undecaprenyl-diphosphatase
MPFESLNIQLFQLINAPADPWQMVLMIARFFAVWVVFAGVLWLVVTWIKNGHQFRFALLDTFLTAVVALVANQAISSTWYHARPFETGLGRQFLDHATESSFPSDHAVFMFALFFATAANAPTRKWAGLFLVSGIGVAWSRIYLGVHFPFDMIGAFGVAFLSMLWVKLISLWMRLNVYPLTVQLYETIIATLKLPPALFPRFEQPS